MRKLFCILLLFLSIKSLSQGTFPIPQNLGAPNANVQGKGTISTLTGFTWATNYADTTTANAALYVKFTPGMVVRTNDTLFWVRNTAVNRWVPIGSGGGGSTELANQGLSKSVSTIQIGQLRGAVGDPALISSRREIPTLVDSVFAGIKLKQQGLQNGVELAGFGFIQIHRSDGCSINMSFGNGAGAANSSIGYYKGPNPIGAGSSPTLELATGLHWSGAGIGGHYFIDMRDSTTYSSIEVGGVSHTNFVSTSFGGGGITQMGLLGKISIGPSVFAHTSILGYLDNQKSTYLRDSLTLKYTPFGTVDSILAKDANDLVIAVPLSAVSTNIYNSDGTLSANRTVSMVDKTLDFSGLHTGLTLNNSSSNTTISADNGILLISGFVSMSNPATSNDTTTRKILVYNTSTNHIEKSNWGNSPNLYNSDGTLTGSPRTLNGNAGNLQFTNLNKMQFDVSTGGFFITGPLTTITAGTITDGIPGLSFTATQPTVITGTQNAVSFSITSAGSSSQLNRGILVNYLAGYTGSSSTSALVLTNAALGTGNTPMPASESNTAVGNFGLNASTTGTTAGAKIGVVGSAQDGSPSIGILGLAQVSKSSTVNIGVMGSAFNGAVTAPLNVGGFFSINQTTLPAVNSALIADNGASAQQIFGAYSNAASRFTISSSGAIVHTATSGVSNSYGLTSSITTSTAINVTSSTQTSGIGISYTGTSTVLAANNRGFNVNISGANGTSGITAVGFQGSVTNTNATSGTNTVLLLAASGATTSNRAIDITAGDIYLAGGGQKLTGAFSKTPTGDGLELDWTSGTNTFNIVSFRRGAATYGNLIISSLQEQHTSGSGGTNTMLLANGRVFFGGSTSPTALVHLGAGTATASTAPLKFTTGTSLTSAEAGAMEYTTPQLFFTNGGGQRQELFQGQQSRVSTQFDKTSSTALANITGLTATVVAGKFYRFIAVLFTTSNSAGGVQFAIAGTATATTVIYEGIATNAGASTQGRGTALGTSVAGVTAVTAAFCRIEGFIQVNAAGTITVQFAQNASNGTASSVLVGSMFEVIEMP